ncbi:hypothetical protein [Sandaracinus amylolyticus]|uniref:hypothetical protein n=1 Tax=Sandaracinus amylolyticus TaxID=927083 RepID=UPI001F20A43F|nr:hypothetical protein [Sandaracinus amylolyticus]UJR83670.1 Hypothetical protein I5071_57390 [Sandaracinus amylolyticus]
MAYQVNPHVQRLARHLPFATNSGELYEESIDPGEGRPAIPTMALGYVRRLVDSSDTSLIVLTGDAGHGKTHLCRRVVQESYGYDGAAALALIKADAEGSVRINPNAGRSPLRPLRILRDLSEIEPASRGADRMAELLADRGSVAIVCANEGRLRDAISQGGHPELEIVLETLERSISEGTTSIRPDVHVINLNWQSVTAPTNSFVAHLLRDWVADRRRWAACKTCDAASRCPIAANQAALGGADPRDVLPRRRRDALEQILRTLEQSGYVLTIRETLMFIAYVTTGMMDCVAVAREDGRSGLRHWGHRDFVWALYERQLSAIEKRQLPVLERIRRLDPGIYALPSIDEALVRVLDREDVQQETSRSETPPRTVRDARNFAERYRVRVRRRRRLDFFDGAASERYTSDPVRDAGERALRIGLRHYAEFVAVFADRTDTKDIRNRLLDGLHVLQGLRPAPGLHFNIADPAFARAEGRAPIIARRFQRSAVRLVPLEACWSDSELPKAVDWTPRRVAIQFGDEATRLELDLLQFELVARAAGGVVARRFYAAESRRILARLAAIAGTARSDTTGIQVMDGDRLRLIEIDNDVFVVGDP